MRLGPAELAEVVLHFPALCAATFTSQSISAMWRIDFRQSPLDLCGGLLEFLPYRSCLKHIVCASSLICPKNRARRQEWKSSRTVWGKWYSCGSLQKPSPTPNVSVKALRLKVWCPKFTPALILFLSHVHVILYTLVSVELAPFQPVGFRKSPLKARLATWHSMTDSCFSCAAEENRIDEDWVRRPPTDCRQGDFSFLICILMSLRSNPKIDHDLSLNSWTDRREGIFSKSY